MSTIHRKIWNLIRAGSFHGYLCGASGYPLTLSGCMPEYPVSLSVSGNTIQDGTPSPDNPVEIQSVGERTANLFNVLKATADNGLNYEILSNNKVRFYGTKKSDSTWITVYTNVDEFSGKTCIIKWQIINSNIELDPSTCTFQCNYSDGAATAYYKSGNVCNPGSHPVESARWYYTGSISTGTYVDFTVEFMLNEGTESLPYEAYGYKVPVTVSGINLSPINVVSTETINICTQVYLQEGKTYTFSRVKDEGYDYTGYNLIIGPENTGYINGVTKLQMIAVGNVSADFHSVTFTAEASGYLWINGYSEKKSHYHDIMLNEGSESLPYEPYHEPQHIQLYTDSPLYGNGNVSDTVELDISNKKATLTRRYYLYTFTGDETWDIQTSSLYPNGYRFSLFMLLHLEVRQYETPCNRFKTSEESSNIDDNFIYAYNNRLYICCGAVTSADELNAFFTENETKVLIPFATPVTTDISDIQDWSTIPKLWRGTAVLTSDTTIEPSSITAEYYADKPSEEVIE